MLAGDLKGTSTGLACFSNFRQISSHAARLVPQRMQKRVMSLAVSHKMLKTKKKIDLLCVDLLLADIVSNIVKIGDKDEQFIRAKTSFDPIKLEPDRAVPLALPVTEAATNALRYSGISDWARGEIHAPLVTTSKTHFSLKIAS